MIYLFKFVFSSLLVFLMFTSGVRGQGLAVNASGAAANASAMLDVSSNSQGVLVPRMTASQRTGISGPATGLLVYQTDAASGFYYYNGSSWTSLSGGTPTGSAGGDLTGSYPNPTIANNTVTVAKINASGSASSSTYLRGDGSWATPSGGGGSTGTIGGGISVTALSPTTYLQTFDFTGTSNRLLLFSQTNNAYWASNTPSVAITLGAASLYAPGTQIKIGVINNPDSYSYPYFTLNSSSSTFHYILNSTSGANSVTFAFGAYGLSLVTDGVDNWYILQD